VREAGLGKLSKATASRLCTELRERFEAFKRRDLYDVQVAALFLDAVFLAVRPDGPKEGVLVAWGFTEQGERVLLSVMLGMRESHEDWLALGRDLIARGLGAPLLVVADGALPHRRRPPRRRPHARKIRHNHPDRGRAGRPGLTEADPRPSTTPPRPIHHLKSAQTASKRGDQGLDFHRSREAALARCFQERRIRANAVALRGAARPFQQLRVARD
jgi:hypothetical protein